MVVSRRSASNQAKELDRLTAFSDGVFAIAITLIVLGLDVPDVSDADLGQALSDLGPNLFAYFVGFAVIGMFWFGHHRVFAQLDRSSGRLVWVNMLLLAMISLMPFTTNLIGEFGDTPVGVSVYATNVALAFIADGLVDWTAKREQLFDPGSDVFFNELAVLDIIRPAIFLASIPVAFLISTTAAQALWLALIPLARATARRSRSRSRYRP